MNHYKTAPTFLYNLDGKSEIFTTQEAVDQAWEDGWFGPPWLVQDIPLLSSSVWETKASLVKAVKSDPRYTGLKLGNRHKLDAMIKLTWEFEQENGVESFVKGD